MTSSPPPLAAVERRTWWRRQAFPWLLLLGIALRCVAIIAMIHIDMIPDMM